MVRNYKGQLPAVEHEGKELCYDYEFEVDDSGRNLTMLHLWRKGFILGHAEDVEIQLDGSELKIVSCKMKSRAVLTSLLNFHQNSPERPYTVSLIDWGNQLNQLITARYPQYD